MKFFVEFGNRYAIIEAPSVEQAEDLATVEFGRRNGPFMIRKANGWEIANFIVDGNDIYNWEDNNRIFKHGRS